MPKLSFFVAMKVVGKQRPRFSFKSQHAYTPRTTLDAEKAIRRSAMEAMRTAGLSVAPEDVPVRVVMTAYLLIAKSATKKKKRAVDEGALPCLKKPDVDNVLKLTDALNGIVFEDDKQIVLASSGKRYDNNIEGLRFSIEWPEENEIEKFTREVNA